MRRFGRQSLRRRGFSTLETVLALTVFIAIAAQLSTQTVRLAAATAANEAATNLEAAVETRLAAVASTPFVDLAVLSIVAPDACSTSGTGATKSCVTVGGVRYEISYDVTAVDDSGTSLELTGTAVEERPTDGGLTAQRSVTVTADSSDGTDAADSSQAVVRIIDTASSEQAVYLLDSTNARVAGPLQFNGGVAATQINPAACAAGCKVGLQIGTRWALTADREWVLHPSDITGGPANVRVSAGGVTEVSVRIGEVGGARIQVLAQHPSGGSPQPGAYPGSVCIWATPDIAGAGAVPVCNTTAGTTAGQYITLDQYNNWPVPADMTFSVAMSNNGTCTNIAANKFTGIFNGLLAVRYPQNTTNFATPNAAKDDTRWTWSNVEACSNWTWGWPAYFAETGGTPQAFGNNTITTGTGYATGGSGSYDMVWNTTTNTSINPSGIADSSGYAATGEGDVEVWSKPRGQYLLPADPTAGNHCTVFGGIACPEPPQNVDYDLATSSGGNYTVCGTPARWCMSQVDLPPVATSPTADTRPAGRTRTIPVAIAATGYTAFSLKFKDPEGVDTGNTIAFQNGGRWTGTAPNSTWAFDAALGQNAKTSDMLIGNGIVDSSSQFSTSTGRRFPSYMRNNPATGGQQPTNAAGFGVRGPGTPGGYYGPTLTGVLNPGTVRINPASSSGGESTYSMTLQPSDNTQWSATRDIWNWRIWVQANGKQTYSWTPYDVVFYRAGSTSLYNGTAPSSVTVDQNDSEDVTITGTTPAGNPVQDTTIKYRWINAATGFTARASMPTGMSVSGGTATPTSAVEGTARFVDGTARIPVLTSNTPAGTYYLALFDNNGVNDAPEDGNAEDYLAAVDHFSAIPVTVTPDVTAVTTSAASTVNLAQGATTAAYTVGVTNAAGSAITATSGAGTITASVNGPDGTDTTVRAVTNACHPTDVATVAACTFRFTADADATPGTYTATIAAGPEGDRKTTTFTLNVTATAAQIRYVTASGRTVESDPQRYGNLVASDRPERFWNMDAAAPGAASLPSQVSGGTALTLTPAPTVGGAANLTGGGSGKALIIGQSGSANVASASGSRGARRSGSIEAWAEVTTVGATQAVAGYAGHRIYIDADGKPTASALIDGTTYTLVATDSVAPYETHHYVSTYDGTTFRLYVDGAEAGSQSIPTDGTKLDTSNPVLYIGQSSTGTEQMAGAVDNVAYYGRALTPGQVASHTGAGRTGSTPVSIEGGDTFTFRVQVVDAAGNPVAGKAVSFYNTSNYAAGQSADRHSPSSAKVAGVAQPVPGTYTTDADGYAELELTNGAGRPAGVNPAEQIYATVDSTLRTDLLVDVESAVGEVGGNTYGQVTAQEPPGGGNWSVPRRGTIRVKVELYDSAGDPVSGETLRVVTDDPVAGLRYTRNVTTNDDGAAWVRFSAAKNATKNATGEFRVVYGTDDPGPSSNLSDGISVTVDDASVQISSLTKNIEMIQHGTVDWDVLVKEDDETPVSNATVSLRCAGTDTIGSPLTDTCRLAAEDATTGADGTATLTIEDQDYQTPGQVPMIATVNGVDYPVRVKVAAPVYSVIRSDSSFGSSENNDPVETRPGQVAIVSLQALDTNNSGIPNTPITGTADEKDGKRIRIAPATTGPDGRAVIRVGIPAGWCPPATTSSTLPGGTKYCEETIEFAAGGDIAGYSPVTRSVTLQIKAS